MNPIISKSFGGLTKAYYFRHLFFGLLFTALVIFLQMNSAGEFNSTIVLLFIINALLYPYARFVYESIVGFIVGETIFVLPLVFSLFFKIITMALCFTMALFIAPVGLVYLYFLNSKK